MIFDGLTQGVSSVIVTMGIGFNSLFPSHPSPLPPPPLEKPVLVNAQNLEPSTPVQEEIKPQSHELSPQLLDQTNQEATAPLNTALVLAAEKEEEATPEATVEKLAGPVLPPKKTKVKKVPEIQKTDPKIASTESDPSTTESAAKKVTAKSDQPTPAPSSTTTTPKAGSQNFEIIWQLINNHRASIGLPAFEKDERLCKIAETRAPQLQNEIFGSGTMHQGMKDMNLPYWNTENIVAYGSEQANFNWWMSDGIHRKAIESNNKYSCGTCLGNACVQEFSSFIPK